MKVLITGGCKNGKSGYAQELSCALSPSGKRFYVATMIPSDEEDREWIRRHMADREGLGFNTVEIGRIRTGNSDSDLWSDIGSDAPSCLEILRGSKANASIAGRTASKMASGQDKPKEMSSGQRSLSELPVYMVDSLTALLGNEMFHDGITDRQAGERLKAWLAKVLSMEAHVILIADDIFCGTDTIREDEDPELFELLPYSEETILYRDTLGRLTQYAAELCDTVIEMELGRPHFLKGNSQAKEFLQLLNGSLLNVCSDQRMRDDPEGGTMEKGYVLIIGGTAQGKLAYAKKQYGITDDEVFECTEYAAPDFSKRCIVHLERYVLYCLRKGLAPEKTFSDGTVLIADDIFRGIVPLGKETRAYREAAGHYLTSAAKGAREVKRVVCGLEA